MTKCSGNILTGTFIKATVTISGTSVGIGVPTFGNVLPGNGIDIGSGIGAVVSVVNSSTSLTISASAWSSVITYAFNAVVLTGGHIYYSLAGSNTNEQPDISPTWWQSFDGTQTVTIGNFEAIM